MVSKLCPEEKQGKDLEGAMFGERRRRIEVDVEELLLLNNNEKGGEEEVRWKQRICTQQVEARRALGKYYLEAK
jgi:hypothetical protein